MAIRFDIVGAVKQEILILAPYDEVYTEEQIAELLSEGELMTTTWFTEGVPSYITNHSGDRIAQITDQEIDGEYSDFDEMCDDQPLLF